jgi:hypothetical protein
MTQKTPKALNILSCVPQQRYTFEDKLAWVEKQAKTKINGKKPDVIILPQEYHGGIQHFFFQEQGTTEKVSYAPHEITDPYVALSKKHGVGITVGSLIDDPDLRQRRERIYVIDPLDGVTGFADKMMLPAYDHIDAKGKTMVTPENDMSKRAKAFDIMGARVSILFCWEVYSSAIWHAIARAQPDFVASMIKFGVNGWPQKAKVDGQSVVTGFGFGNDGGWIERLQMASKWDIAAPIICSTNSWNLPKKCGALAGQILPWAEKEIIEGKWPRKARASTLWNSSVNEGGKVRGDLTDDYVQMDVLDVLYWRYIRDHKFNLYAAAGEWPSSEQRAFTMNWKIKRMERKFLSLPKLEAPIELPKAVAQVKKIEAPKGPQPGQGLLARRGK